MIFLVAAKIVLKGKMIAMIESPKILLNILFL